MYTYKIIDDKTFQVTDNKRYRSIWNGDENKAQETVDMLNLQDLNMRKEIKKQQLAELRYVKETSGITINGNFITTDRNSQAKITGAYNATQISGDSLNWKTDNGWVTLTPEEVKNIALTVFNHVQACFNREEELSQEIDTNVDADISLGWPDTEYTV